MSAILADLFPLLEWFCFGGLLISTWLYKGDDISGPLTGAIASGAFVIYGYYAGMPAASITNIAFFAIHIRNLIERAKRPETAK